jgi:SAM-dependent methyltransferase
MLTVTSVRLATVDDLFRYKSEEFELPPFDGYGTDQWGIKAHNRPWIVEVGNFKKGERVLEVGGAYSRLPEWLGERYGVEPWIGDDFGAAGGSTELWSRWGDPQQLPGKYPSVNYVFENLGHNSPSFPDQHFDCIFSVSTLEHVPAPERLDVLKDMNRCTAPGGRQLHSIDIPIPSPTKTAVAAAAERMGLGRLLASRYKFGIAAWWNLLRQSGINVTRPPSSGELFSRQVLVESPDVVYRFYPPNDQPKTYRPAASLLIVIEDV